MDDPTLRSLSARAVLVAAGRSTRMGDASTRKPFLDLDERTILEVTCAAFARADEVTEIVLVVHPEDVTRAEVLVVGRPDSFAKVTAVVPGGAERIDSVRASFCAGESQTDVVAIHDAARPLIEPAVIGRAIRTAAAEGSALVAVPVRDTVKSAPDGQRAERTLDRDGLWLAQTPQCFQRARFLEILDRAEHDGFRPTDDAALWERYVGAVPLVEGALTNLKITTSEDLETARALLRGRGGETRTNP